MRVFGQDGTALEWRGGHETLPSGTRWLDAWTGDSRPGGQWLTAAAPLDRIPVYMREGGAIEPFGGLG